MHACSWPWHYQAYACMHVAGRSTIRQVLLAARVNGTLTQLCTHAHTSTTTTTTTTIHLAAYMCCLPAAHWLAPDPACLPACLPAWLSG